MGMRPLHDILCEVLGAPFPDGENHCYFQPPADLEMAYPCIRYNYSNDVDEFADNIHYTHAKRYTVTIIDEDPDSEIPERLIKLPYCYSNRNFAANGLNHFVYTVHYNGPRIKEVNEDVKD